MYFFNSSTISGTVGQCIMQGFSCTTLTDIGSHLSVVS